MAKVSVILVNYNTYNLTADCIRSLKQFTHTEHEIILVDNASTQGNADQFLSDFPGIKLIRSEKNGGIAYGNNLGIAQANGDYILLLNNDTILTENSIGKSLDHILEHPDCGVLGCRMVYPNGDIQYSARKFRSISWELLDLFKFIPWMMPYRSRSKKMLGKYFRHDTDIEADWINGAFFMFPRKILDALPRKKLDDRFFMYGEDQLWCEQIRKLGLKVLFYAGTTIIHIHGGSSDLNKQLALRKTFIRHELEIMRLRKGRGIYYFAFKMLYVSKESVRNLIKKIFFRSTGKLIR